MSSKIFRSSFFTAFLVLIISIVMIMGVLFEYFENQIETELKSEANYISHALENEGLDYFDGFESEKRVSIIDFDGNVIYDNTADISTLDNHKERDEIRDAISRGTGKSSRYSDTLAEKTVYYAIKLDNFILRVSTTQYTIVTVLLGLLQPMIIVLVLALILCFVLSSRVAKSIVKPINDIDIDNPEKNDIYEELSPLLSKISKQKRTIKRQLDEATKQREEFNLITENMSEGFLLIDKETMLLTHNSAALRLLGIDTALGGSVLSLCRVKEFRDVVEKSLSGENAKETMVLDNASYRLIANPVYENDSVIGAVIIIVDVTETENREALRREFTANVSHELKTPLTSISGFAELMKNGGTPEETVIDFSSLIYKEAQRLITLVSDIIKISELDERQTPYEITDIDIYKISQDVLERLQAIAKEKNISLNLIGESACISGAEKIVDEMIYNLCDNAIKYNKENGSVDVIINSSDKKVKLIVRDTGIGIPQSEQQRVFERFYRVDKSHSKKVGGTGLGLAIVKHGAMYLDAEVSLESTEGKGTSVTLEFNKYYPTYSETAMEHQRYS